MTLYYAGLSRQSPTLSKLLEVHNNGALTGRGLRFETCPYQKSRLSRESLLRHGDKQFKPSYACNVP